MQQSPPQAAPTTDRQRIAVVGAGISGLGAAWTLARHHDVTVYEANDYLGGHSNTVEADFGDTVIPVDTGFIVYNEHNYLNLTALFAELDVPTEPSDMSFGASLDGGRLEYAGSPSGLFAQRTNLFKPRFWRMIASLWRFYKSAPALAARGGLDGVTIEDLLIQRRTSRAFREDHLLPMIGAIWSAPVDTVRAFPADHVMRFFDNHRLFEIGERPRWRTVSGGSREYVNRLASDIGGDIRLGCTVASIARNSTAATVTTAAGAQDSFDQVVIGAHGDQALAMLADPTADEQRILGRFKFQRNRAVLHRDSTLMPQCPSVWSSWNYLEPSGRHARQSREGSVTYWMNRLQNIDRRFPLFLSINPLTEPAVDLVFAEFSYDHPLYDLETIKAQHDLGSIQGARRTWFCGAYCGYGFHEDGLSAGLDVAQRLGATPPWIGKDVGAENNAASAISPQAAAA